MSTARVETQLQRLSVLVASADPDASQWIVGALRDLRISDIRPCLTAAQARMLVRQRAFDLCFVDAALPDDDGAGFVAWLRHSRFQPLRSGPVMVLAGRPTSAEVLRLRDAGATSVVRKGVERELLVQRLHWALRNGRPFIDAGAYRGPERRNRRLGPPPGKAGRRREDLPAKLGKPVAANLLQAEIDLIVASGS